MGNFEIQKPIQRLLKHAPLPRGTLRAQVSASGTSDDKVHALQFQSLHVVIVPGPLIVRAEGEKLSVAPIRTSWLPEANPDADAPMIVEPNCTPLTLGCDEGTVAPAGISTDVGLITAFVVSLVDSVTTTPVDGAGTVRVTGNGTD